MITRPKVPGAQAPGTDARTADEALAELYADYARPLLRTAALLIWAAGIMAMPDSVRVTAEEIVHNAFTAMHREWRRLRDADRAVRFLRRAIVDGTRSCASAPRGDLAGDGPALLAALRRMPERQREALVLRYYADLPEAQAAAAMGVSTAAFRSHAARGMAALASITPLSTPSPTPYVLCPRGSCAQHGPRCAQRNPQP